MVLTKEGRKLCVWLSEPVYLGLKAESLETRRPVSEIVEEAVVARVKSDRSHAEGRTRQTA